MSNVITITARIIDAEKVKASIGQIGDVSGKTAKEIQQHSRAMVAAEKEIEAAFKTQAAEYRAQREAMRNAQIEAANAARQAAEAAKDSAGGFAGMAMSVGKTAGAFALAQLGVDGLQAAIGTVTAKVQESITAFAEQEQALNTLDTVIAAIGGSVSDARAIVERFNDSISSQAAVAEAVRNLSSMGLTIEQTTQLIERIRDGAVGMGADVNQALVNVSRGIKQGNSEILDNIGVTKNVSVMHEEYAAKLGKTASALSEFERNQAIANGVILETEKYAGLAAKSTETLQGKIHAHEKSSKDLAAAVGERLAPAYEKWLGALTGINKELQRVINPNFGKGLQQKILEAQEAVVVAEERARQREKQAAGEGLFGSFSVKQAYDNLAEAQRTLLELQREFDRQHKERATETAKTEVEITKDKHQKIEQATVAHKKRIRQIEEQYPPLVMSGINSSAPGLNISGAGLQGLSAAPAYRGGLGVSGATFMSGFSVSGGQTLPSASLSNPGEEWYASIKTATENGLFDGVGAAAAGDFGGLGQALTSIMAKAPDPMIQALTGPAGLAITFGAMVLSSFTQAADRARAYGRHLEDLAAGGNLTKEQQRQREIEDDPIRNQKIAERDSLREQAMQARTLGGTKEQIEALQRYADAKQAEIDQLDKARQASWDKADADERAERAAERYALAVQKAAREMDVTARKQEDAFASIERYREAADPNYAANRAKADAENSLGIVNANRQAAGLAGFGSLDEMKNEIVGGGGLGSDFWDSGKTYNLDAGTEADIIKSVMDYFTMQAGQKEAERVGPGDTPDRPLYSAIVNFKDMMAFFAPGELMRAQGPGTRRADGMKGRAVNTRGA